uniref:BBX high mobility group box domain containing n=1 Tax=Accipiter nisus TaxID=211598 RepID=A0A8B9MP69_9AVES
IWKKNLKRNSTAFLNTVLLPLTGKIQLFRGKRERLEAAHPNNQNPTKVNYHKTEIPVSLPGRIKFLYLKGKQGKPRSRILSEQQMEKPKELPQSTLQKTSSAETDCNSECSRNAETEENHSITSDMPAVSAFFSLAALAEVAAMENVHRYGFLFPLLSK